MTSYALTVEPAAGSTRLTGMPTRRTSGPGIVAVGVVVSSLLQPVQSAAASCTENPGAEGSSVIFVGTAESERRGFTRFAVEEIHAGPDLAPEVWVRSGQEQPPWPLGIFGGVGSSGDADFVDGERYRVGANSSFVTGLCSVSEADRATRRPGARPPVEAGALGADPPIGPLGQTLWVSGLLALGAASVAVLRRRRRNAGDGAASPEPAELNPRGIDGVR